MLLIALLLCCVWDGIYAMPRGGTCSLGNAVYQVGEKFHPDLNSTRPRECVNCTCLEGGKLDCNSAKCPKADCAVPAFVGSKCCPVCEVAEELPGSDVTDLPGCVHNGVHYEDGARFPSNTTAFEPKHNQCVLCDCFRGHYTCHVKTCTLPSTCIKTTTVPDDCCRVCTEIATDEDEEETNRTRHNGDCLTAGRRHKNGSKWKPEVEDHGVMECVVCQCINNDIDCKRIRCPVESALKCKRPQRRRGGCCRECLSGKRRTGRKHGKKSAKKGDKRADKKEVKKGVKKSNTKEAKRGPKKSKGKNCKKMTEEMKERKKKSRKRRCRHGSKRKGKSRKRKGASKKQTTTNNAEIDKVAPAFPSDSVVSDVMEWLCLPRRSEKLVYITKTTDMYSLALDGLKDNSVDLMQWIIKRGRIEGMNRKVKLDPASFRSQMKVEDIVGSTTNRHVRKFMKKLDRKQKRCKKKCRRKMLDRLFKKLRTKKLDLTRKCKV